MRRYLIAILALAASAAFAAPAVNSDVNSENIDENICVKGWTKTVRPPVSYTNDVKERLMGYLGIPWSRAEDFELDHTVPLTLGGHPSSLDNLRLQAWDDKYPNFGSQQTEARRKDRLEVRLNRLVCAGELDLDEARQCIYDDWRKCEARHPAKRKERK